MNWISVRNFLILWVEKNKGYIVHFKSSGDLNYIDTVTEEIVLDESIDPEVQTYILLHECGHILVWENGMMMGIEKKAARHNHATAEERTFTVIEEIEAWKRGLSLAKRLNISVNMVKWEEEMADAIGKYITWAAQPNNLKKGEQPKP